MARAPKKTETTPTPSAKVKSNRRISDAQQAQITNTEISRLAYQLYEARGRTDGNQLQDWLQAEQQLSSRAER